MDSHVALDMQDGSAEAVDWKLNELYQHPYWQQSNSRLRCGGRKNQEGKFLTFKKEKKIRYSIKNTGFILAEQEGFEPSVPFWGTHDFQSCPL